jgi:sodium/hydrogen exchanger-like protein 6/7
MSRRTQLTTKYLFQVMAQLSENFIFIYLGLDLFTETDLQFKPLFILVAVVGICVARYMSVFPLSKAINWFIRYRAKRRGKDVADELPFAYQGMLFWAGLRGAVGVALAARIQGANGPPLRATVLVVVVLTVIIFGGTTARMLEILGIRTGVVEEIDSDDEFDIEITGGGTYYKRSGTGLGHNPLRSDLTIPLDSVSPTATSGRGIVPADGRSNGRLSPHAASGPGMGARKNSAYSQQNPRSRSRDGPSTQNLLGDRSGSHSGSASGSSAGSDDAELGGTSFSRNRNSQRTRRSTDPGSADLEDLDVDLDTFSDDDLPPPASSQIKPPLPRTPSHQRLSPSRGPPVSAASPGEAASSDVGQPSSRPTLSGATTAFRGLFSGNGTEDHATWFKQLDEDYIKPKLLLDQSSGHKGPGAV